jgi:hypothetical protein
MGASFEEWGARFEERVLVLKEGDDFDGMWFSATMNEKEEGAYVTTASYSLELGTPSSCMLGKSHCSRTKSSHVSV